MELIGKLKSNLYWLPSLFMIGSALFKFLNISPINEWNNVFGSQYIGIYIGVIELISVVFFLFKPTMLVGFFFICVFWGGNFSASIIAHATNYFPIFILIVFGLAFYWRKPSLFSSKE